MNASIVILPDGAPCIVLDEDLPHPIGYVVFDYADFCLTLMYAPPQKNGYKLSYPLDHPFVETLKAKPVIAVTFSKNNKMSEISAYPVAFINN